MAYLHEAAHEWDKAVMNSARESIVRDLIALNSEELFHSW